MSVAVLKCFLSPPDAPSRPWMRRDSASKRQCLGLLDARQHRDFGEALTVWEAAAGGLAELLRLERSLVEQSAALAHDEGTDISRCEHPEVETTRPGELRQR